MSQSSPSLAAFCAAALPPVREAVRADDTAIVCESRATRILIATINRHIGDTGVQTHARALHDGLAAAGMACDIVTPFERPAMWLPIFAMRKLLAPFNPTWSTRWYRHWHAAALRQALMNGLVGETGIMLAGHGRLGGHCPHTRWREIIGRLQATRWRDARVTVRIGRVRLGGPQTRSRGPRGGNRVRSTAGTARRVRQGGPYEHRAGALTGGFRSQIGPPVGAPAAFAVLAQCPVSRRRARRSH